MIISLMTATVIYTSGETNNIKDRGKRSSSISLQILNRRPCENRNNS